MDITWLGHSAFLIKSEGAMVLVDPFFTGNSLFQPTFLEGLEKLDAIVITHGHSDHIGDTVALSQKYGATVCAIFEVCQYLGTKGLTNTQPMNLGGSITLPCGVSVALVQALHSASLAEAGQVIYMGAAGGAVISTPTGTFYHTGDTEVFSDMALIDEIYQPDVVALPVGNRFTMSATTAALACNRFLKAPFAIPMHYGTFPIIENNPQAFTEKLEHTQGIILQPGGTFTVPQPTRKKG